jgi:hypothetical protein
MAQIYVSYRRVDDRNYWATTLINHLISHFGDRIQRDIQDVSAGTSFTDLIRESVLSCNAMLVIMGPDWLEVKNQFGQRRIDEEGDIVRFEISTALSLNKIVIPVLLGETFMPQKMDLPADLGGLVERQAIRIQERSWNDDADHLIAVINDTFVSGAPELAEKRTRGVFISYSHKDEEWKDRLVTQLSVLEVEDILHIWDDRKIQVGDKWNQKISDAMEDARIAILLISADFLISKFIRSEEVPKLLARQEQEGLRVVALIVRPCAWKLVPWLAEIQVRPKDGRPLSAGSNNQIDQDLADLVTEISIFTS